MEAGSVVLMDLLWSVFELLLSDYYCKILVFLFVDVMIYLFDA
jgi:hypothetical protein